MHEELVVLPIVLGPLQALEHSAHGCGLGLSLASCPSHPAPRSRSGTRHVFAHSCRIKVCSGPLPKSACGAPRRTLRFATLRGPHKTSMWACHSRHSAASAAQGSRCAGRSAPLPWWIWEPRRIWEPCASAERGTLAGSFRLWWGQRAHRSKKKHKWVQKIHASGIRSSAFNACVHAYTHVSVVMCTGACACACGVCTCVWYLCACLCVVPH